MKEKVVKVGIVGFGTIGSGVAKILLEQADNIASKTHVRVELSCVVDLDTESDRPVKLPPGMLTNEINKLLDDDSIDIGVELVGGTVAAREIQMKMLASGKDVVTANKALLAEFGNEIYNAARNNHRCIAFEASCAGGIPIVSAIRTGLVANEIKGMYAIVNGTCNYILTNMARRGQAFSQALSEAKQKGYAESDPVLDITGSDSAHKLAILSSIAFGCEIRLEDIYTEGIEKIRPDDIRYGAEMGYCLKLLAIGQKADDGKISLRVHPSFIANDNALAGVDGSFNAISIFADAVGQVMFYGRGAGMMPTASAVVADIIDVACGNCATTFENIRIRPRAQSKKLISAIGGLVSRFYIRLMVKDQAGVFAQIGKILADNQISISGILQHEGRGPDNTIPVVITTHPTRQNQTSDVLNGLAQLDTVCSEPVCIRIVDIPEDKD